MPLRDELWLYRPGGLGDVLLTIPAFQAARRRWPHLQRVLAIPTVWHELPWIATGLADRLVDARGLEALAVLFSERPAERPAALVAWLSPRGQDGADAWMERADEVLIGEAPQLGECVLPHAARRLLRVLEPTPAIAHPFVPWAAWGPSAPSSARTVLLAPGAGHLDRCAPATAWLQLARVIRAADLHPVWLWGPAEQERAASHPPLIQLRDGIQAAGDERLDCVAWPRLLERLPEVRLAFTHDSGPGHLLAACGVPTRVVFVASSPGVWLPLGAATAVDLNTFIRYPERMLAELPKDNIS